MMQSNKNSEVRERWRAIIQEAEGHPVSVSAYCRENGISAANLYVMRGKLRKEKQQQGTKSVSKKVSPFSRLEVLDARNESMPDPKWVAAFLREFIKGGLS